VPIVSETTLIGNAGKWCRCIEKTEVQLLGPHATGLRMPISCRGIPLRHPHVSERKVRQACKQQRLQSFL
jgi:hypothetical protein